MPSSVVDIHVHIHINKNEFTKEKDAFKGCTRHFESKWQISLICALKYFSRLGNKRG